MYYLLELMQQCRDDAVQGVIADYVSAEPPMIPALVVRPSLSLHTYSLSACRQCVQLDLILTLTAYADVF